MPSCVLHARQPHGTAARGRRRAAGRPTLRPAPSYSTALTEYVPILFRVRTAAEAAAIQIPNRIAAIGSPAAAAKFKCTGTRSLHRDRDCLMRSPAVAEQLRAKK
jgi:hypothetical protein